MSNYTYELVRFNEDGTPGDTVSTCQAAGGRSNLEQQAFGICKWEQFSFDNPSQEQREAGFVDVWVNHFADGKPVMGIRKVEKPGRGAER